MVKKYDSFNSFKKFTEHSKYSRVDEYHPLDLMIGLNSYGEKTIQLKSHFKAKSIVGTSCISVKQTKINGFEYIQFSLINDSSASLFYIFCNDLVDASRDIQDPSQGYSFITNRFHLWKKMFVNKISILSEEKIKGLIGELLFLRDYSLKQYDYNFAINGWSGVEKTHKDFSYDNKWYEIKTISSNSSIIKISSIEQLSSTNDGELVVNKLEKMSNSANGISLNSIVLEIRDILKESLYDLDIFLGKLEDYGYSYNEEYDKYVYVLKETNYYLVNESFPKIRKSDLMEGIINASYEISLPCIESFKI